MALKRFLYFNYDGINTTMLEKDKSEQRLLCSVKVLEEEYLRFFPTEKCKGRFT